MPGPKEKKIPVKKRSKVSSASTAVPKKKPVSRAVDDVIPKSKQLAQRLRSKSTNRSQVRALTNNETRVCGNGKPMPSLADLEKMFEDSDGEEEPKKPSTPVTSTPISSQAGCSTPKKEIVISNDKLTSPNTIKTIASKMLDFISNLPDPTVLLDTDEPPPPVIPPKKRKKTEIPYIVGCKDRPKVPSKPTVSFCKGEEEYGVNKNDAVSDDEIPKKRAKRTKKLNVSKSIFNAKSDEIAARLKECEGSHSDGSTDSSKTVVYDNYTPYNATRSFSPIPSTSKDNETILKNEQRFSESLISDTHNNNDSQNDIEIIEPSCETIVIDDDIDRKKFPSTEDSSVIEIIDDSSVQVLSNDHKPSEADDKCIEIIENKNESVISPVLVDDYYSSLDINQNDNEDLCEIIDVDDVIAENKSIIEKYRKSGDLDSVTCVELNDTKMSTNTQNTNNLEINTSNDIICLSIPDERQITTEALQNPTDQLLKSRLEKIDSVVTSFFRGEQSKPAFISNLEDDQRQITNEALRKATNQLIISASENFSELEDASILIFDWLDHRKPKHPHQRPSKKTRNPGLAQASVASEPPPQVNPSTALNDKPQSKGLGDCPICMESLSNNTVASTMCGHIFCMKCIQAAIKASGKKCPTCRMKLKGAGYHQIFL